MNRLLFFLLITFISACKQEAENKQKTDGQTLSENVTEKMIEEVDAHEPELIKSAHYFSSAWPVTFWQEFEEGDVADELQQIKNDGFNTIILVVPWRGFEVGFEAKGESEQTQSNPLLYDRLAFVLAAIVEQDLKFILRLGFPHFHTAGAKTYALEQCIGIYTDQKTQNQWVDYLEKIKQITQPFQQSSAGTLISWEDFWCPHTIFPKENDVERLQLAQKMQYGNWLQKQNQNMVKMFLQQSNIKFNEVKIPQLADLSYTLYLDFIDQMFVQKILQPAQNIFTDAAMEVRVDKLPIKQKDHYTWIGHDLHLGEKNLRGTYWAPFWGAENKGELISAGQALKNFEYFLNVVTSDGQYNNHVIEQFNFYDNTVHYPNNANIIPGEIDDFLIGVAPLLKQYSRGFGVWAYRDYHDNVILNGSFEMGTSGWQINGQADIRNENQDNSLWMSAGTTISQTFLPEKRFKLLEKYETISVCLVTNHNTILDIKVDDVLIKQWHKEPTENCVKLDATPFKIPHPHTITLSLSTQSDVLLDEIKVFGFTQVLGLYDATGKPAENIGFYRQLNDL